MLPRVIQFNEVSLDGRLDWFTSDMGLYYGLAARWQPDAMLSGSNTMLPAFASCSTMAAFSSLNARYWTRWSIDSANLVTFNPRTGERREVLTGFASYPGSLVKGPDGALYVSNQVVSFSFTGGDGSILRIVP